MLSEAEMREIEEELSHSPSKQAACIEALKVIQRNRGWVSDESLAELAEFMKMSPAELDSVATFYNLIFRREVGRHVILICDSVSCWITGYDNLVAHFKNKLGIEPGQTTSDGRFTLLTIPCLGVCEHAPAMVVDRQTFWELTEDKIDKILEDFK
ncbi:MAG: NADH-quinone oxidoreductase subunit NuoE [candidate division Zixibacteria bacterium]|nr:NADH-quinone oxidoreductase subunit NuoE [candidate division Zixibacteria bacterium]